MVEGRSKSSRAVSSPSAERFSSAFVEPASALLDNELESRGDEVREDPAWSMLDALRQDLESPVAVSTQFREMLDTIRVVREDAAEAESDPALQTRFCELQGTRIVIRSMILHADDDAVPVLGCSLLAALANSHRPSQEAISAQEGLNLLLDILSKVNSSVTLTERALNALRVLTYLERARKVLNRLRVVPIVIEIMRRHQDPTIQEVASTLIANMSFGSPQNKERAGRDGAIAALIDALRNFPDLTSVQIKCCRALRNLAWTCEANQKLIGDLGGVQVILDIMTKFSSTRDLQENCCAALSNVSYDNANALLVIHNGGLELLLKEIEIYMDDSVVLEHAMSVLRNVFASSTTTARVYQESTVLKQILEKIFEATTKHVKTPSLAEKGCSVIRNVAVSPDIRQMLVQVGAIPILLSCLKAHWKKSGSVVEVALAAFHSLASGNDDVKVAAGKGPAIELILKCLAYDPSAVAVQETGCMLLDNLADGNESNARVIVEKDGLEIVVNAMNSNTFSVKLQEYAYNLFLKIISAEPGAQARLSTLNLESSIDSTLKQHHGNTGLESLANQLQSFLLGDSSTRSGRSYGIGGRAGNSARSRSRNMSMGSARSRSRNATRSRSVPRRAKGALALEAVPE